MPLPISDITALSHLDIIWTCAATIFTCTGVFVPECGESTWRSARSRLSLMSWAVVATELATVLRAMKEWHEARILARKPQSDELVQFNDNMVAQEHLSHFSDQG